jgi:Ankyrin repeat
VLELIDNQGLLALLAKYKC